jgi:hypothetical protein
MSWREFSHGTGTECIHIMQALCMQVDQRVQSTRLSGMHAHTVHAWRGPGHSSQRHLAAISHQ